MTAASLGLAPHAGGVTLAVTVAPNARGTAVDGWHGGALRIRLAAPPVEGKANARLIEWLADELGLPRRAVRLASGATSRRKRVEIDAPIERVRAWLASAAGDR